MNFTYDADGNMTSDGRNAVCEEADDNITRYIRDNGRLVTSDSENARTYYHYAYDSLGSITHMIARNEFGSEETNGYVNGRILCRYDYDAFGNTINAEETITNRYDFTGEMHDSITDMYYMRARCYAPDTGRFAQTYAYHRDRIKEKQWRYFMNVYSLLREQIRRIANSKRVYCPK